MHRNWALVQNDLFAGCVKTDKFLTAIAATHVNRIQNLTGLCEAFFLRLWANSDPLWLLCCNRIGQPGTNTGAKFAKNITYASSYRVCEAKRWRQK